MKILLYVIWILLFDIIALDCCHYIIFIQSEFQDFQLRRIWKKEKKYMENMSYMMLIVIFHNKIWFYIQKSIRVLYLDEISLGFNQTTTISATLVWVSYLFFFLKPANEKKWNEEYIDSVSQHYFSLLVRPQFPVKLIYLQQENIELCEPLRMLPKVWRRKILNKPRKSNNWLLIRIT